MQYIFHFFSFNLIWNKWGECECDTSFIMIFVLKKKESLNLRSAASKHSSLLFVQAQIICRKCSPHKSFCRWASRSRTTRYIFCMVWVLQYPSYIKNRYLHSLFKKKKCCKYSFALKGTYSTNVSNYMLCYSIWLN